MDLLWLKMVMEVAGCGIILRWIIAIHSCEALDGRTLPKESPLRLIPLLHSTCISRPNAFPKIIPVFLLIAS